MPEQAAPPDQETIDSTAEELDVEREPLPAPAEQAAVVIREGSTAIIEAPTAAEKVKVAQEIADTLSDVIKKQGLRTKVGRHKVTKPDGKEVWEDKYHVDVEGWQTLGTFLDVATQVVWSRKVIDPATGRPILTEYEVERCVYAKVNGNKPNYQDIKAGRAPVEHVEKAKVSGYDWEAKVVAVRNGVVVGEAESMCSRTEESWRDSDDFALRSMAQTRATSRAIAAAARWIVTLAGYAGTPAEEMGQVNADQEASTEQQPAAAALPGFAKEASSDLKQKTLAALATLMSHGEGPDREAALEVLSQIKGAIDGAFPAIAGITLIYAARKLVDLDPDLAQQAAEASQEKAEAKAAQDAAEKGDAPAPEDADPGPDPESVGDGFDPAPDLPAGAVGADEDIPF